MLQGVPISGAPTGCITTDRVVTPELRPATEQAKFTAPGRSGSGLAGEQAAVAARGKGLGRHPMLPPPADALLVDPAAQPYPKRIKKKSGVKLSSEASGCLQAA